MKKRRVIQLNLDDILKKHGIDQKTLHKMTLVREGTIGKMAKNQNKSFTRDNLNSIINALDIQSIEELI